jgi:class 3 adenylate cyclase/tetratricopeptide (TPR) repeat protein
MDEARLRRRLAALLPRSVWPLVAGRGEGRRAEGTVLFADLAGFTALTENLARMGKEGAEELTRILNAFFSAQVGVVHRAGGDVLRFGGDAVTVFFGGRPQAALGAALAMQEAAGAFREVATRGGVFSLAMKIGVARGPVLFGLLGNDESGRDYFAAGRALDEAAEAEHRAVKGQVVLSPSLAGEARGWGFSVAAVEGGFGLLEGSAPNGPPEDRGEAPEPPPLSALEAFLPPFAVEKARLEEGLWAAEHRRTTVLFLAFSGLDYDGDPRVLPKLDAVYSRIASLVGRHGGTVNKVDMGDKGSKAIALFGAPRALERAEEAACRAALEILEDPALRASLTGMRAGITSAPLFAGWVGSEERREFTVMGDGINMAARLMANAFSWRVLCDGEVRRKAGDRLAFRILDPIFVKGKEEKVPVFRPEGDREETSEEERAFVGREDLLGEMGSLLRAPDGPFALAVTGPPGVGKSAFLHRLGLLLEGEGVRHLTVPLSAHSTHGYLSAVRPVLFAGLGVSRLAPAAIKVSALEAAFAPEDRGYFPLLGPLLGLDLQETEEVRALSPKERKDLLFALLQRLLRRQAASGPYLWVVDGLENADGASLDFLKALLEAPPPEPLKVLLAFREGAPAAEGLLAPERVRRLSPFTAGEVQDFLVRAAGLAPPSEAFVAFLLQKTQGIAHFLDQLVRTLKEQGLLRLGADDLWEVDEDRLASARFPDTLEGLLLARLERLPEGDRLLLKTAAVLGASFSVNLLAHLLGRSAEALLAEVRRLAEAGFVRMDSWGLRPYAVFTDPLLRDALYESLNFETRRGLHRAAAHFLEEGGGEREPRLWPALARHFEAASETGPASRYLGLCAGEARARYDNTAAFGYLERLVALKEAEGSAPALDLDYRKALLHLAESAKELGRLEEAEALSRKILDAVSEPCEETVVSLMRLADIERRRGNLERSLELDEEAMARCGFLSDPVLNCRIHLDSGVSHAMAGRFEEAMKRFQRAEGLAQKAGAVSWQAVALMNQGLCHQYGFSALKEAEALFRRTLALARRHALKPQSVSAGANLAQVLSERGRYRAALRTTEEVLPAARQFGYRNMEILLSANLALYRVLLGRWEEAREAGERACRQARSLGLSFGEAPSLHAAGILDAAEGRFERAFRRQGEALALFLACHREEAAWGVHAELLALTNALRLTSLEEVAGKEAEAFEKRPVPQGPHGLAVLAQRTLRQWRGGEASLSEAWLRLEEVARKAGREEYLWLLTEAGEALVRLLLEAGKPEEAAVAGLALYPHALRQDSPLKTGAFLLALGEALHRTGRKGALRDLLGRLDRWRARLDRGLPGLRYHLLKAEVAAAGGSRRAASGHARAARATAEGLLSLQGEGPLASAVRALPEVERALGS